MSRRPPRTSHGYLAPPDARVAGWKCSNNKCGTTEWEAPRSWPHRCHGCGHPADPTFEEPWAHDAKGYRIRRDLADPESSRRETAEIELMVWTYKQACLRGDRAAAEDAWQAYRQAEWSSRQPGASWMASWPMSEMVAVAARFGDVDRAADEILGCYPFIDTRDVDNDNTRRTISRGFVSTCIGVLECEATIDHPREAEIYAAMRDVANRIDGVLMDHHHRGFQRLGEMRAFHRSRAAIAQARRAASAAFDGLPPVSWIVRRWEPDPSSVDDPRRLVALLSAKPRRALTLVDAVIDVAQTHDDIGLLDDLLRHLEQAGTYHALTHLVRARRHAVTGDLDAALRELALAAGAGGRLAPRLRPQILATHGLLLARINPDDLETGIALCRAGRKAGLRWWRRKTPADAGLARLLLRRASRPATPPAARPADVRQAVGLMRRVCGFGRRSRADDRLLLHEALAALDALQGNSANVDRHIAWARSVETKWSLAARARLAAAWAEWAVGTGVALFAAEAYHSLVALAAKDAMARYGAGAKQRVLAAAQDYAEEAGYWLARTGHYREAVLALEIGRAVGLSEVLGRDNTTLLERLRGTGRAELADDYQRAVKDFEEQERHRSAGLRQAWLRLRDVAGDVWVATGADPLALDVSYEDVTAQTGDGAIVYLSAAKAGGYALVVAATHDPQFIDLPKLDRATVAKLVAKVHFEGAAGPAGRHAEPGRVRDLLLESGPEADPMAEALRTLWQDGLKDLVLFNARGRIVTLIPVGQLNLLPLHAVGEPGTPGDEATEWRHVGHFSAIRYAPNARSLRRCRQTVREFASQEHTLLAIDVPQGHGVRSGGHLLHVARETAEVTRRWKGRPARPVNACTWEQFRAAADHHTAWHLACHGSAEPQSILDSRLCFADRQVTLEEMRRSLKPSRRRLAVLSACRTNISGSAMPNEVIGLPSVLIQIGFAGVIATGWAVDDLATTYLMTAFYHRWCQEGDEPAVALNRAQQWLRTATRADLTAFLPGLLPVGGPGELPYAEPRYWAAFAYTGA